MLIYTIYLANWSTSKILWSLTKEKYLERWPPHESIREKKPEDVFLCVKKNLSNFLQSSFPDNMKTARGPITMLCIEKSEGKTLGEKIMIKPAPAQQSLKTWRGIHNVRSTSHLSFVYSLSPPFSGGAREHDMAYLTQITALCQTSHFLLDMQAASWDKQTPTDAHTKAGAESTQNLEIFPLPNTRKTNETFPFFSPKKREVKGRGEESYQITTTWSSRRIPLCGE